MKYAMATGLLMLSVAQLATADTKTATARNAEQLPSESKSVLATVPAGEILSDDFMRDVSDGSSTGESGEREQEESGETIEQTLRVNEKSALH